MGGTGCRIPQGWDGISLLIQGFVHKHTPNYTELPARDSTELLLLNVWLEEVTLPLSLSIS